MQGRAARAGRIDSDMCMSIAAEPALLGRGRRALRSLHGPTRAECIRFFSGRCSNRPRRSSRSVACGGCRGRCTRTARVRSLGTPLSSRGRPNTSSKCGLQTERGTRLLCDPKKYRLLPKRMCTGYILQQASARDRRRTKHRGVACAVVGKTFSAPAGRPREARGYNSVSCLLAIPRSSAAARVRLHGCV